MDNSRKVDFLIVGQGLAGSCLALQLHFRQKTFVVFDQPEANRSTVIAAGLFNPITGKMLTKSWQADVFFPYLYEFYPAAEQFLKKSFFHPGSLYRPFSSVEEQNEWMGRSTHASMKKFITDIKLKSTYGDEVNDPVGGVLIQEGGYVDTMVFMEGVRSLLKGIGAYEGAKLEEEDLAFDEDGVAYHGIFAKKIIFCGGVHDLKSRFFTGLPIKPLKGETLAIRMAPVAHIYNKGVFIVPTAVSGEYRVGSTYDFDLTPTTTTAGREELVTKLNDLIRIPYTLEGQDWGIRPTTPDRRIMLGPHPFHPNIVVFNGLGTKGVSLAPYYSKLLAEWLGGEGEITPEVNIRRFKSLYSKFD